MYMYLVQLEETIADCGGDDIGLLKESLELINYLVHKVFVCVFV